MDVCQLRVSDPLGSRLSNFVGVPALESSQPADPSCPRLHALSPMLGWHGLLLARQHTFSAGSRLCCSATLVLFMLETISGPASTLLEPGASSVRSQLQ